MKPLKLLTLSLVVAAATSLPVNAKDSTACYSVDAKRGWQYLQLSGTFSRVTRIRGSWTVDVINQERVGAEGYGAVLEEYNGSQYDPTLPLGALLIGNPGEPYSWLYEPQQLSQPVENVALRINDDDLALADNFGSIQVCFSN